MTGEVFALITAFFWTFTALAFESASKRIGSLHLNIIRLSIGLIYISIFTSFQRGYTLPVDAGANAWIWLSMSGLVGFVIGDYFLFKAFSVIGARVSLVIMTLAPLVAAVFSYFILGEVMSFRNIAGMLLTISGISMVILSRNPGTDSAEKGIFKLHFPLRGLFFAFIGALGQGVGLVLSKLGMGSYNAFASTQIRIIAGIIGFALLFTMLGQWKALFRSLHDKKAMTTAAIGSFFGPFLGVSFSLLAVQRTHAGIAQTIMSLTPVFILPISVIIHKEKINLREIIGTVLAVAGTAVFFI